MDGTQGEVSTAIFDITQACLQSFIQVVIEGDQSLLTQHFVSSDSTLIAPTSDFLGLYNRFLLWVNSTGAGSSTSSSMDSRLQGLEAVSSKVVELLEMLLGNLRHCQSHLRTRELLTTVTSSVNRKPEVPSTGTQSPTKLHLHSITWEEASQKIANDLHRLHKIAAMIKQVSARRLNRWMTTSDTEEDRVFLRDIKSWVRHRFPAARKTLCQQLSKSVAIRREILQETECQARRLAVRRASGKVPSDKQQDSHRPSPELETKQKVDNGVARSPSVLDPGVTKTSRPDPRSSAPQILHSPKQPALTTALSTISTSQEDTFQYPPMPKVSGDETCMQCPFCLKPLEGRELEARDDYWKHHIDEHLEPYGCLDHTCATAQVFFTHRDQWKAHMESAHSKGWLRSLRRLSWCCDIDHDLEIFETEQQWREHMQNLDNHPPRKMPAETQLYVLSLTQRRHALRDEFVCPLCEEVPQKIRPLVEMGQGDPSEMFAVVLDHVADHLKSLSLMAVSSLTTADPEWVQQVRALDPTDLPSTAS